MKQLCILFNLLLLTILVSCMSSDDPEPDDDKSFALFNIAKCGKCPRDYKNVTFTSNPIILDPRRGKGCEYFKHIIRKDRRIGCVWISRYNRWLRFAASDEVDEVDEDDEFESNDFENDEFENEDFENDDFENDLRKKKGSSGKRLGQCKVNRKFKLRINIRRREMFLKLCSTTRKPEKIVIRINEIKKKHPRKTTAKTSTTTSSTTSTTPSTTSTSSSTTSTTPSTTSTSSSTTSTTPSTTSTTESSTSSTTESSTSSSTTG